MFYPGVPDLQALRGATPDGRYHAPCASGASLQKPFAGIDAALYMESELVSRFLNRFPWDVVYQVH